MTRAVPQTAPIPVLTQRDQAHNSGALKLAANSPEDNQRDRRCRSARGYQEFFASLAAWPSRLLGPAESLARLHIYASSSRSENALSCRRQGHRARITARFRGACGLRLRTGGHLLLGDVRGRSILRQRSLLLCRIVGA